MGRRRNEGEGEVAVGEGEENRRARGGGKDNRVVLHFPVCVLERLPVLHPLELGANWR